MAMQRIRKGDQVAILAGRDKGKRGEVLRVLPADNRVVVQGVNMVKRHRKPTQVSPAVSKKWKRRYTCLTWHILTLTQTNQLASVSRRWRMAARFVSPSGLATYLIGRQRWPD